MNAFMKAVRSDKPRHDGFQPDVLCFQSLVPVPQELINPLDDHGRPSDKVVEWEIENWGCSGGVSMDDAIRLGPKEMAYHFFTLGSPPLSFLKTASLRFPTLTFTPEFREPNLDFKGWTELRNGSIEEHVVGPCHYENPSRDIQSILVELCVGHEAVVFEQVERMPDLRITTKPRRIVVRLASDGIAYFYDCWYDDGYVIATACPQHLRQLLERIFESPHKYLTD